MGESARERLGEWIRPDGGVVLLTVECQRGVVGAESALPELAAAARASGALRNVARLVAAAKKALVAWPAPGVRSGRARWGRPAGTRPATGPSW